MAMLNKKAFYYFFIMSIILSCSSNDKEPIIKQEASFALSGAINEDKTAVATVNFIQVAGTHTMTISIHDGVGKPQTFSLGFYMGPFIDAIEVPKDGFFKIGSVANPETDFWMVYTNPETGKEYGSNGEMIGTLTIEESTQTYIKGSFEFDAPEKDPLGGESSNPGIMVKNGKFTAQIYK